MIFALLTEVIAVHVQLIIVYLWYLSLKGLLMLYWRLFRFLIRLQVGLHEFFEQFIGREKSRSGNRSGNQSKNQLGPWVGLQDGTGEVLPEWRPPTGPRCLASSSSIGLRGERFQGGERQVREPSGAILIDDLRLVMKFSSKRASWPVGYRAFKIVKWST